MIGEGVYIGQHGLAKTCVLKHKKAYVPNRRNAVHAILWCSWAYVLQAWVRLVEKILPTGIRQLLGQPTQEQGVGGA